MRRTSVVTVLMTSTLQSEHNFNRDTHILLMLVGACRSAAQIPGVPIMYISNRKYTIERMPEAFGAPQS
jgi:hypothetical protein